MFDLLFENKQLMGLARPLCDLHIGENEFELVEIPFEVGTPSALELLQVSEIEKSCAFRIFAVEVIFENGPDVLSSNWSAVDKSRGLAGNDNILYSLRISCVHSPITIGISTGCIFYPAIRIRLSFP